MTVVSHDQKVCNTTKIVCNCQSNKIYHYKCCLLCLCSYKFPNGEDSNPDISQDIGVKPEDHLKVTQEQYVLYSDIGTTFQLCKICAENDKNVRLEPCGHLLCSTCVENWQESGGTGCPFCREQIRDSTPVVIEPFQSSVVKKKSGGNSSPVQLLHVGSNSYPMGDRSAFAGLASAAAMAMNVTIPEVSDKDISVSIRHKFLICYWKPRSF